MAEQSRFRISTRMRARDTGEPHRASSPLELLFDLTFVVAVASVAEQLALAIERGQGAQAIVPFAMVFFAIWWAWVNFTWFASAYDTDDVAYRLLTLVQMGGVLILAAGVGAALEHQNFFGITLGYFIMRIGLVAQWVRAAIQDPDGRATAIRYAVAITLIQSGWLLRLVLPNDPANQWWTVYLAFVVLVCFEVLAPYWAERTGGTTWHPHHIAERYSLFAIILLGETILSLSDGVRLIVTAGDRVGPLIVVGIASLVLIFALWWLYFMESAGDGLERHRERSFAWGYMHYAIFAALAALGGGLEVVVAAVGKGSEVPPVAVGYAVAVPIAIYMVFLWGAHVGLVLHRVIRLVAVAPGAIVVLLLPLAAPVLGTVVDFTLTALVVVLVVVVTIAIKHRAMLRDGVAA